MDIARSPQDLYTLLDDRRGQQRPIGLVPTMGYLHEGHLCLVEASRANGDAVVMSIYVNPSQFGPGEDLERYPRDLARDTALAASAGVDVLFTPDDQTMYPGGVAGQVVWVEPGALAAHLCGASRPGHFRGVCTVVAKLFHLVAPDRAYFGQKDAQQAIILQRMVRDLAFPIDLRIVPTVREPDGLAKSSRNTYLTPNDRHQAVALHRALQAARQAMEEGERDAHRLEDLMQRTIAAVAPSARVDYATVADLETLQPIGGNISRDALLAVAAFVGKPRLIDNLIARVEGERLTFS